jgi:hypothetical protein
MIGEDGVDAEMVYETKLNAFDRIVGVMGYVGDN